MRLDHGGHLTHGSRVNFSGQLILQSYGVHRDTGVIDYDELETLASEHHPDSSWPGRARIPDFSILPGAGDSHKAGAYFMVDMAHVAGMVAVGLHPSPIPHAHVVILRLIRHCVAPGRPDILQGRPGQQIDKAVFPDTGRAIDACDCRQKQSRSVRRCSRNSNNIRRSCWKTRAVLAAELRVTGCAC